ncbi:hypothetical protein D9M69_571700 [compost metagenome]
MHYHNIQVVVQFHHITVKEVPAEAPFRTMTRQLGVKHRTGIVPLTNLQIIRLAVQVQRRFQIGDSFFFERNIAGTCVEVEPERIRSVQNCCDIHRIMLIDIHRNGIVQGRVLLAEIQQGRALYTGQAGILAIE